MSNDTAPDGPRHRITIVKLGDAFLLYEGEDYIDAILSGDGLFPLPIRTIAFESPAAMQAVVGKPLEMTGLWAINPGIMKRLEKDGHLKEIEAHEL